MLLLRVLSCNSNKMEFCVVDSQIFFCNGTPRMTWNWIQQKKWRSRRARLTESAKNGMLPWSLEKDSIHTVTRVIDRSLLAKFPVNDLTRSMWFLNTRLIRGNTDLPHLHLAQFSFRDVSKEGERSSKIDATRFRLCLHYFDSTIPKETNTSTTNELFVACCSSHPDQSDVAQRIGYNPFYGWTPTSCWW